MKNVIYKISTNVNSKIYIGSSVRFNTRVSQHRHHLLKGTHHSRKLQNHVKKYGIESLKFEVIETCDQCDLLKREQFYIDTLNPFFNIVKIAGSQLGAKRTEAQKKYMVAQRKLKSPYKTGWKHTDEAKKKMSEAGKDKIISEKQKSDHSLRMTGRKHTDEVKVKISKILTGRTLSEDHKKNLSKSAMGNTNWKNINYDNPERNKKISLAMKKRQSKPVINIETGERYNSAKDAAKAFGMAGSTFSKHLSGFNKKNKTPFIYEV